MQGQSVRALLGLGQLFVSLILRMPRSQELSRDLQQRMAGFRGGHCDQDIELS